MEFRGILGANAAAFSPLQLLASEIIAAHSQQIGFRIRLLGFVNNIFDKFGVLNAPFTAAEYQAGSIIRPRTYGLRVDVSM